MNLLCHSILFISVKNKNKYIRNITFVMNSLPVMLKVTEREFYYSWVLVSSWKDHKSAPCTRGGESRFWNPENCCFWNPEFEKLFLVESGIPLKRLEFGVQVPLNHKVESKIDLFSLCVLFSQFRPRDVHKGLFISYASISGTPNENIVQNHLNIALLNVF